MTTTTGVRVSAKTNVGTYQMYVLDCGSCGIVFAIPDEYDDRRREDHRSFYCPNGHSQVYRGKTEAQKLREKLAEAERQRDQARASRGAAWDQVAAANRSASAFKGHLTRLRNRIANGVCPCCQRSFVNVRAHIAGQHPEWAAEHAAVLTPAGQ